MTIFGIALSSITPLQALAFTGAFLAVFSALNKSMIPLRIVAILSTTSVAAYTFMTKDLVFGALYSLLIFLNTLRLREMLALSNQTRGLEKSDFPYEALKAFMKSQKFAPEAALFRKGDIANEAYYIVSGHVALPEMDIDLGPGSLVGEMGLFGEKQARSLTVVAKDHVTALKIPYYDLQELCLQNPAFGLDLFKLIVRRQVENQNRFSNRLNG
jgi:CRP/FNR family transcriptional regulator, cyclic AMP receptor protein